MSGGVKPVFLGTRLPWTWKTGIWTPQCDRQSEEADANCGCLAYKMCLADVESVQSFRLTNWWLKRIFSVNVYEPQWQQKEEYRHKDIFRSAMAIRCQVFVASSKVEATITILGMWWWTLLHTCMYTPRPPPGKLTCQWKITIYLHSWLFFPASHVNFQGCIYFDRFVNAKSLGFVGLWASFPEVAIWWSGAKALIFVGKTAGVCRCTKKVSWMSKPHIWYHMM